MDLPVENPTHDIKQLQRCINDLVSLLALPAVWSGREPSQIIQILADALLRMLSLDFIYARLKDPITQLPMDVLRIADSHKLRIEPEKIRETIETWINGDSHESIPVPCNRLQQEATSLFPVPLGVQGEFGVLIIGCERVDFPGQTESLLLSVAANEASLALREAILLNEQKRIASELEQRVTERTAGLAAANEELKKEILARKRAEEKLRRSEDFLAEGQRLTLTGSFSWKVAMDEITWSEQLYRIYEFDVGVPVTLELIRTRVHPEDVSLIEKMKTVAETAGDNDFEWHWRLKMPDHSIKYLHAIAHLTRDRNGQREYIAAVQDVTARHLSQEALVRTRSELANVARVTSLGVLTASMAHEVNQPLSGIITNASTCLRMLSAKPPNVDGARETARRTIRDGNRASDVITRLRTLYSKKDPQLEWMDLNETAREVASLSLNELQQNRVTLRQELAQDLPLVIGDRIQLQQVIMNLLRNASEAMSMVDDRPRELLIRTQLEGGEQVQLSVKDVGVGFVPEVLDKLFDAFFTTKREGMGIGLSISRSIIDAHQGRLWATANSGPGATFSFSIPCRRKGLTAAEKLVDRINPARDAA